VEQQAQDRIHRLGQFKPIHVTRFIIGGTIEERILKLQVRLSCIAAWSYRPLCTVKMPFQFLISRNAVDALSWDGTDVLPLCSAGEKAAGV